MKLDIYQQSGKKSTKNDISGNSYSGAKMFFHLWVLNSQLMKLWMGHLKL